MGPSLSVNITTSLNQISNIDFLMIILQLTFVEMPARVPGIFAGTVLLNLQEKSLVVYDAPASQMRPPVLITFPFPSLWNVQQLWYLSEAHVT